MHVTASRAMMSLETVLQQGAVGGSSDLMQEEMWYDSEVLLERWLSRCFRSAAAVVCIVSGILERDVPALHCKELGLSGRILSTFQQKLDSVSACTY